METKTLRRYQVLTRVLAAASFFSTMPGHSMLQMAIGWRSEYEVEYGTLYGNNTSLVHYGNSLLFSLLVMMTWWCAVGYAWGSHLKPMAEIRLNAMVIDLLLLGKAVDLVWEGRLFTGNYWLLASLALMVLFVVRARRRDDPREENQTPSDPAG
jgi:hypothetical protein